MVEELPQFQCMFTSEFYAAPLWHSLIFLCTVCIAGRVSTLRLIKIDQSILKVFKRYQGDQSHIVAASRCAGNTRRCSCSKASQPSTKKVHPCNTSCKRHVHDTAWLTAYIYIYTYVYIMIYICIIFIFTVRTIQRIYVCIIYNYSKYFRVFGAESLQGLLGMLNLLPWRLSHLWHKFSKLRERDRCNSRRPQQWKRTVWGQNFKDVKPCQIYVSPIYRVQSLPCVFNVATHCCRWLFPTALFILNRFWLMPGSWKKRSVGCRKATMTCRLWSPSGSQHTIV